MECCAQLVYIYVELGIEYIEVYKKSVDVMELNKRASRSININTSTHEHPNTKTYPRTHLNT